MSDDKYQEVRPISPLNPEPPKKAKPGFSRLGGKDSQGKVEVISAHGDSHPQKPIQVHDRYSKSDPETKVEHGKPNS